MDDEKEIDLLLIEDSEDDIVFFREALDQAGLRVRMRTARNGAEANQIIFRNEPLSEAAYPRPKLIVLDLKMPKLNGIDLLARLKRDQRTSGIPVVIFSSSQEKRDLTESYRLGANSYLVKPMEAEKFSEAVRLLGLYWLQLNEIPRP